MDFFEPPAQSPSGKEERERIPRMPAWCAPLTRVPLDGAAIREAAARSQPVWPDQAR